MRKIFIALAVISIFAFTSIASAQGHGTMWGEQGWNYCPYCGQYLGPRGGYGMMGGGYGTGPGMMWGGYGRGHGRGHRYYQQNEECQNFLDQSAGLRKELNNKRFDYFEAMRNPKTTEESLAKLEKEIRDLQEKIYSKAPQGCW